MPELPWTIPPEVLLDQAVAKRNSAQEHAALVLLLALAVLDKLGAVGGIARHRSAQLARTRMHVLLRLRRVLRKVKPSPEHAFRAGIARIHACPHDGIWASVPQKRRAE